MINKDELKLSMNRVIMEQMISTWSGLNSANIFRCDPVPANSVVKNPYADQWDQSIANGCGGYLGDGGNGIAPPLPPSVLIISGGRYIIDESGNLQIDQTTPVQVEIKKEPETDVMDITRQFCGR